MKITILAIACCYLLGAYADVRGIRPDELAKPGPADASGRSSYIESYGSGSYGSGSEYSNVPPIVVVVEPSTQKHHGHHGSYGSYGPHGPYGGYNGPNSPWLFVPDANAVPASNANRTVVTSTNTNTQNSNITVPTPAPAAAAGG